MAPDRRLVLAGLLPCLLPGTLRAAAAVAPTAMLLPLSGSNAALGRAMRAAAELGNGGAKAKGLLLLDAGLAPAGVAQAALKRGAGLIAGPLRADEVRAVVAAVDGRVPVLAFSNDAALAGSGALQLGITASQVVRPLLNYARSRGVRRVALASEPGAWAAQVADAARTGMAAAGLELVTEGPDALLVTTAARAPEGVQLLAAPNGLDPAAATLGAWEGAWAATPDPETFADFAAAYETATGATPGLIAGLAYDAARIGVILRASGGSDRSALLARAFKGVCGDLRFRADGSADRAMTIVAIENGRYRVVEKGGVG